MGWCGIHGRRRGEHSARPGRRRLGDRIRLSHKPRPRRGDKSSAPPTWAYPGAHGADNRAAARSLAPRHLWTVVNGLRRLGPTKCARPWFHDSVPLGFAGVCPTTRRGGPCVAWHPRFTPLGGVTVRAGGGRRLRRRRACVALGQTRPAPIVRSAGWSGSTTRSWAPSDVSCNVTVPAPMALRYACPHRFYLRKRPVGQPADRPNARPLVPARGLRHEGHEQILRFFRVEDLDRIESGDPADAEVGHPRPRRVSSAFHSGTLGSPRW